MAPILSILAPKHGHIHTGGNKVTGQRAGIENERPRKQSKQGVTLGKPLGDRKLDFPTYVGYSQRRLQKENPYPLANWTSTVEMELRFHTTATMSPEDDSGGILG